MSLSVAEVLEQAANRCERTGAWCHGVGSRDQFGRDSRESKCVPVSHWMMGHVAQVCDESNAGHWDEIFKLVAALTNDAPTGWNDAPGRTQAEVVAKLREAAALARAGDPS